MPEPEDPLALPDQEVLFEGAPDHLADPLREWIESQLRTRDGWRERDAREITLRLRMTKGGGNYSRGLIDCDQADLLRVVNAILEKLHQNFLLLEMAELELILQLGGSAYGVDFATRRLTRRVSGPAQRAKTVAEKAAPPSARHLEDAWVATYGINPDYDKAISSAIKAVEAALTSFVSATNPEPTLSKSLATLRRDASDWVVALPDLPNGPTALSIMTDLMRSMLKAHTSRHAGPASRIPYAVEAESVVHLAVAIVQMLSLGGLRRV